MLKNIFRKKYNILVLGSDGMLGYDVYQTLLADSAKKGSNIGVVAGITRADAINVHKPNALDNYLNNAVKFDYCINCIAHTNTKEAEYNFSEKLIDYDLNATAPKYIAETCKAFKIKLIHISTDYVFSHYTNTSQHKASDCRFLPCDTPHPVNVYGKNKLIGELNIQNVFGIDSKDYAILRVSWLYGMHNSKSFIHKFLKNVVLSVQAYFAKDAAPTSDPKPDVSPLDISVGVTDNEYSIPTSTQYVVECIKEVISKKRYGIFHAVPIIENDSQFCGVSRYEFAQAILENIKAAKDQHDKALFWVNDIDITRIKLLKGTLASDTYISQYTAMKNTIGPVVNWIFDLKQFMTLKNIYEFDRFVNEFAEQQNKTIKENK